MSDKENKEPTAEETSASKEQETQETAEGTYSRSFEEWERSKIKDPNAKFFFNLLNSMSTEYQDEKSEETRSLFSTVDKFKKSVDKLMSTPEGQDLFIKELERRVGKIRGKK